MIVQYFYGKYWNKTPCMKGAFLAIENVKGVDLRLPILWFVKCWQLCKYNLNEAKFEGWQPSEAKGNKVLR